MRTVDSKNEVYEVEVYNNENINQRYAKSVAMLNIENYRLLTAKERLRKTDIVVKIVYKNDKTVYRFRFDKGCCVYSDLK